MKNSIRLFCILLGVCYILSIGNGFLEFAEGWSEASHDVIEQKDGEEIHRVNLDLKPLAGNIFPDTLQLSSGDKYPYQLSAVTVAHKTSDTYQLVSALTFNVVKFAVKSNVFFPFVSLLVTKCKIIFPFFSSTLSISLSSSYNPQCCKPD